MSRRRQRVTPPRSSGWAGSLASVFVMSAVLYAIITAQRGMSERMSEAFVAVAGEESAESVDMVPSPVTVRIADPKTAVLEASRVVLDATVRAEEKLKGANDSD